MLELRDVQPHGGDLLEQQRRVLHQPRAWQGAWSLPRRAPCQCYRASSVLAAEVENWLFPHTSTSEGS